MYSDSATTHDDSHPQNIHVYIGFSKQSAMGDLLIDYVMSINSICKFCE